MTAIQLLIFHERYLKQFVWVVPEKSTESDDSSVRFTMASDSSPGSGQPVKPESVGQPFKTIRMRAIQMFSPFFIRQLLADLWRYVQKYKKYVDFCCLSVELHYFKVILALGFFVSLTKVRSQWIHDYIVGACSTKIATFPFSDHGHPFRCQFIVRGRLYGSAEKATRLQQLDLIDHKRHNTSPDDSQHHIHTNRIFQRAFHRQRECLTFYSLFDEFLSHCPYHDRPDSNFFRPRN